MEAEIPFWIDATTTMATVVLPDLNRQLNIKTKRNRRNYSNPLQRMLIYYYIFVGFCFVWPTGRPHGQETAMADSLAWLLLAHLFVLLRLVLLSCGDKVTRATYQYTPPPSFCHKFSWCGRADNALLVHQPLTMKMPVAACLVSTDVEINQNKI